MELRKKQVKYASFMGRMIANFLDVTWMTILFIPIGRALEVMFFKGNPPSAFMRNLLQDILAKQPEITHPLRTIFGDHRMYEYFITNNGLSKLCYMNLIQLILFSIIIVFFWVYKQATPGKMLLSLKIVDATSLEEPSKGQYLFRYLGYIICSLPFFLGFLSVPFNKNKQGWHDKLARTIVIKK